MQNTRLTMPRTLPPVGLASIAGAVLVLIVAAIALDRVAEFGLKQVLLHSSYRYMRVYAQGKPARYLVIGNSRAGVHFPHSAQDDGDFFNLGNGGMGVAFGAALAADYVDHHGAPQAAIIEMSFITDPKLGEEAAGLTRVFSERSRAIRRDESGFQNAAEHVLHLLRFNHPTLLNALVGLVWERGQRAVDMRIKDAALKHVEQMPPYQLIADPDNAARLARLIADLRQRGVFVVCVLSPLLPQMREKAANLASYTAALRRLAQSNGAAFLDDSATVSERDLFADAVHLNVDGVKKFDRAFLAQLAALAAGAGGGGLTLPSHERETN